MMTADDARKKAKAALSKINKERKENSKKYEEKIQAQVSGMVLKLRPEILKKIESRSQEGYRDCKVGCYTYCSGRPEYEECLVKERALKQLMEELKKKPYLFKISKTLTEGAEGEGNNFSDFYTTHTWTISW